MTLFCFINCQIVGLLCKPLYVNRLLLEWLEDSGHLQGSNRHKTNVGVCLTIWVAMLRGWGTYLDGTSQAVCNLSCRNIEKVCDLIFSIKKYSTMCFCLHTVSTQIERHSRLERQGTVLGCTLVIFVDKSSRNYSIFRLEYAKNDHSADPKNPKF